MRRPRRNKRYSKAFYQSTRGSNWVIWGHTGRGHTRWVDSLKEEYRASLDQSQTYSKLYMQEPVIDERLEMGKTIPEGGI